MVFYAMWCGCGQRNWSQPWERGSLVFVVSKILNLWPMVIPKIQHQEMVSTAFVTAIWNSRKFSHLLPAMLRLLRIAHCKCFMCTAEADDGIQREGNPDLSHIQRRWTYEHSCRNQREESIWRAQGSTGDHGVVKLLHLVLFLQWETMFSCQ